MVTVVVIGLQVLSMCAWVAVLYFGYFYIQVSVVSVVSVVGVAIVTNLYFGYFYIQSTNMELWRQFLFNGLNSTVWGISLEFLNFIIFYKVSNLLLTTCYLLLTTYYSLLTTTSSSSTRSPCGSTSSRTTAPCRCTRIG